MPLMPEKEFEGLGRRSSRLFGIKRLKHNAHTDKTMKIWMQVYFPSRLLRMNAIKLCDFF